MNDDDNKQVTKFEVDHLNYGAGVALIPGDKATKVFDDGLSTDFKKSDGIKSKYIGDANDNTVYTNEAEAEDCANEHKK